MPGDEDTWFDAVHALVCDFVQDWSACPRAKLPGYLDETYRTLFARNWPCDRRSSWLDPE